MARYFGNIEQHAPGGKEEQLEQLLGYTESKPVSIWMTAVGKQRTVNRNQHEVAEVSGTYYKEKYDMVPQPGWEGETGTLFTHRPSHVYVSGAYAHPNLRYTIPLMFAHIHRHLGAQFQPDETLSEHGAALTNKAKKLGFPIYLDPDEYIEGDDVDYSFVFGDEVDEDYMFVDRSQRTPWSESEVPASEIAKSKEHYRNIRQSAQNKRAQNVKSKNTNPDFEQLQLGF